MEKVKTVYVVDANVYITACNEYYAFDLAGSFWKFLKEHAASRRVISIDRVKDEILVKGDALGNWIKAECDSAFQSTSRPDVIYHYQAIINWVKSQNYKPSEFSRFADGADGWLIAYAKATGHTVVTLENTNPTNKKIKIPIVCDRFNVPHVNTFEMLRDLGAKIG